MSPLRTLTVAALAAAVSLPIAASAQTQPGAPQAAPTAPAAPGAEGGHRNHHGSAYMHALRTLNLSDAQKQQIKDAAAQTRQANQNADPATRRANMQKLRSQIDGILTPDQRTQLQAELAKQRAAHPEASEAPHN